MNIKEFDEFVEMWDEEGQPPDVDWLEYAQDFRNQTQELEAGNARLKQENDNMIAEIAGMRDKWTPPDEVQELLDEIERLREFLSGDALTDAIEQIKRLREECRKERKAHLETLREEGCISLETYTQAIEDVGALLAKDE